VALNCKRNKGAFSLLELVVAVALLSIGLTSIIQAFSYSAKVAGLSGDITRAALLAQDKLQRWEFQEKQGWLSQEAAQDQGTSGKFRWASSLNSDNDLKMSKFLLSISWLRAERKEELSLVTYLR
jgi:prepilin-type N-terminal cleavage/methylation domain-containing protein